MRWEYLVVFVPDINDYSTLNDWEEKLDHYGKKGWELIAIENNIAYFKHQIMSIYDD